MLAFVVQVLLVGSYSSTVAEMVSTGITPPAAYSLPLLAAANARP